MKGFPTLKNNFQFKKKCPKEKNHLNCCHSKTTPVPSAALEPGVINPLQTCPAPGLWCPFAACAQVGKWKPRRAALVLLLPSQHCCSSSLAGWAQGGLDNMQRLGKLQHLLYRVSEEPCYPNGCKSLPFYSRVLKAYFSGAHRRWGDV